MITVVEFFVDGGFIELITEVETDDAEDAGEDERNPPGPVRHRLLAEAELQEEDEQRTGGHTCQGAEFEEAAEESAPVVRGVFGHEGGGTTVFTAGGEALNDAEQDEDDGCGDADGVVAGQQGDAEGRACHEQDRQRQNAFAAEAIAHRSPDDSAEGAEDEGHGEGQQRHQLRMLAGEEVLREIGDRDSVETVVEPFGRIAQRRGGDGFAHRLEIGLGWGSG